MDAKGREYCTVPVIACYVTNLLWNAKFEAMAAARRNSEALIVAVM